MTSYYNEFDPKAAAWLQVLIDEKLIPPGHVDTRSISDVLPSDLDGYVQCHFFAGIGGWPEALRLAGWPDDRPVWTGSCPCQPFSGAGRRKGNSDERHLWPHFFHLIEQHRPSIVFGEQVASKDGLNWLDLVSQDLEGTGYAVAAADLCAAGVGSPHIRQRLYFAGVEHAPGQRRLERGSEPGGRGAAGGCAPRGLGDSLRQGLEGHAGHGDDPSGRPLADRPAPAAGGDLWADATHGFWAGADWLGCRDDKWRPVEPGTFPLAHGVQGRVGLLRGYGNAIVPQVGATFVASIMDAIGAAPPPLIL